MAKLSVPTPFTSRNETRPVQLKNGAGHAGRQHDALDQMIG